MSAKKYRNSWGSCNRSTLCYMHILYATFASHTDVVIATRWTHINIFESGAFILQTCVCDTFTNDLFNPFQIGISARDFSFATFTSHTSLQTFQFVLHAYTQRNFCVAHRYLFLIVEFILWRQVRITNHISFYFQITMTMCDIISSPWLLYYILLAQVQKQLYRKL